MIVDSLKQLLADVTAMYQKAQGYHWNVTGMQFHEYHAFFAAIAEDVSESIDPIAENIRKRDAFTPFTLQQLGAMTKVSPNDAGTDPVAQAKDMLAVNDVVSGALEQCFRDAIKVNDQGLADFIAGRLDVHRKWRWQLVSIGGQQQVAKSRAARSTLFL